MISAREAELTKLASDRARALLPPDRPLSVTLPITLTFGLREPGGPHRAARSGRSASGAS